MTIKKNTSTDPDLSKKIAQEEGVKTQEVAKDISEQMDAPPSHPIDDASPVEKIIDVLPPVTPDAPTPTVIPEKIAREQGVSAQEMRKNVEEQITSTKPPALGKTWIYILVAVAAALAVWGIINHFK